MLNPIMKIWTPPSIYKTVNCKTISSPNSPASFDCFIRTRRCRCLCISGDSNFLFLKTEVCNFLLLYFRRSKISPAVIFPRLHNHSVGDQRLKVGRLLPSPVPGPFPHQRRVSLKLGRLEKSKCPSNFFCARRNSILRFINTRVT